MRLRRAAGILAVGDGVLRFLHDDLDGLDEGRFRIAGFLPATRIEFLNEVGRAALQGGDDRLKVFAPHTLSLKSVPPLPSLTGHAALDPLKGCAFGIRVKGIAPDNPLHRPIEYRRTKSI